MPKVGPCRQPTKSTVGTRHKSKTAIEASRPRQAVRSTCIEQIFRLEILIIRLFGGYLFDWPNRKLAIAYKIIMYIATERGWRLIFDTRDEEEAHEIVFRSFSTSHFKVFKSTEFVWIIVFNVILIFSRFAEIYHFNTLNIVLKKRLDERYVMESSTNIRFIKRMFYLWILFGLALPTVIYSESVEFSAFCIKNRPSQCTLRGFLDKRNERMSDSPTIALIFRLPRLMKKFIRETIKYSSGMSFYVGTLFAYLMVTAVASDLLVYASRSEYPNGKRRVSSRSLRVPTVELLIHVRDVMVALRRTMGPYYGSMLILLLGIMTQVPSYALIDHSAGHHFIGNILIIWGIIYLAFMIAIISMTKSLHDAAGELADRSQRQLVDKSSRSYVESQTIVKLADEIGAIWPTDWFEPSLKWVLTSCLSMFVFAVSVHQVAEKKFKREE